MKPLVYIAGPYAAPDPVANTRRAFGVGLRLHEETGCAVLVPHLTLLGDAMFPRPPEFWYEFDLAQVRRCDMLVRLPGESPGADREAAVAREAGIPVLFLAGDDDLPRLARVVRQLEREFTP